MYCIHDVALVFVNFVNDKIKCLNTLCLYIYIFLSPSSLSLSFAICSLLLFSLSLSLSLTSSIFSLPFKQATDLLLQYCPHILVGYCKCYYQLKLDLWKWLLSELFDRIKQSPPTATPTKTTANEGRDFVQIYKGTCTCT